MNINLVAGLLAINHEGKHRGSGKVILDGLDHRRSEGCELRQVEGGLYSLSYR